VLGANFMRSMLARFYRRRPSRDRVQLARFRSAAGTSPDPSVEQPLVEHILAGAQGLLILLVIPVGATRRMNRHLTRRKLLRARSLTQYRAARQRHEDGGCYDHALDQSASLLEVHRRILRNFTGFLRVLRRTVHRLSVDPCSGPTGGGATS
jgi:hypothetical protein